MLCDKFKKAGVPYGFGGIASASIEQAFSDPHVFDVFTVEFLLGCLDAGDYIDPRDVRAHLPESKARDFLLQRIRERGIR